MIKKILIVTLLTALPGLLFADTIYLKTGKILRGSITAETDSFVTIEMGNKWKEIPRSQIHKLVKDGTATRPPAVSPQAASATKPSAKPRDKARAFILSGHYPDAVAAYNPLARASQNAVLTAEYAYALALAGHGDLALSHLDRAFLTDAANAEVMFFGSVVFEALGMRGVSKELHRPPPAWLTGGVPKAASLKRATGKYPELLASANRFIFQRRFVSAAARFDAIVRAYRSAQLPWAGYAIALEKLGAFKAAAKAVAKDIELGERESQETRTLLAEHKTELEARPPVTPAPTKKLNKMLKGRYLAFFGLSYIHTETDSIFNTQTRLGKFLTNRFDVSAGVGFTTGYDISDFNGLNFGIAGRYSKPLPTAMPLNLTASTRLEYQPGPEDNFAIVISPGLSYVLTSGAIDLYVDFSLTGPNKGTQTISMGYTVYFGGAGK